MQNIPGRVQMPRRGLQHTSPVPQVTAPQRTPSSATQRAPLASATQWVPEVQRTVAQAVMHWAPVSPSTQMVPAAQRTVAQVTGAGAPQR